MEARFLIFLPVRNGSDYVREAIESVLAQSVDDWRLVILENASSDDTDAIARSVSDPRISIVPADRPLNIHENWDRGRQFLEQHDVTNSFVTFLGHDDYFYRHFLRNIGDLIDQAPDASLYQSHFDLVDEASSVIRPCRPIGARETWADLTAMMCWAIRDSFGTGYVFRARDYRRVGGIPDLPLLLYSDNLLFMRLARLGYKACNPSSDFAYRLRRGSTSYSLSPAKVNAHAEALGLFADAMFDEFGEFTASDAGRAAVASLLARELFLLNTPALRKSLNESNARTLDLLESRYAAAAAGAQRAELIGGTSRQSRAVLALRRLNLTLGLMRRR